MPRLLKDEMHRTIQPYFDQLREMNNHAFQQIRIQTEGVIITRAGISPASVQVIKVIPLRSLEEDA